MKSSQKEIVGDASELVFANSLTTHWEFWLYVIILTCEPMAKQIFIGFSDKAGGKFALCFLSVSISGEQIINKKQTVYN